MNKLLTLLLTAFLMLGAAFAQQPVTVWTHLGNTDLEWLQSQAVSFEENFGVPVQITRIDLGEIKQKMLLSAPEGEAADLVGPIPHDQIGEMAAGGVLADMSQFSTEQYREDLSEQALLAFTFNNRLFGLPMYVEGPALIVNTDLVSEMPANFEDFVSQAESLTGEGNFGFLYDIEDFYFSYVWINSLGGYVFDRTDDGNLEPSDLGLANEGAVEGARLMRSFQHEYGLIPADTELEVAEGLFFDGKAAMIYDGPWMISNVPDNVPIQVMPIPAMADGTEFNGFMGVQGILMNEFSQNKTTAANFAKWVTRPEAQIDLANRSGRIPSSQAAAEQVSDDPVIAGFAEALANAVPMPNIPEMGNVWEPMASALSVILESPDSNVEGALQTAVNEIQGN